MYPVLLNFDAMTFFAHAASYVAAAGSRIVLIAGLYMVIIAIIRIARGMMTGGRGANWVMDISCFIVGGAIAFGGWGLVSQVASGGRTTISQLGSGGGSDAGQQYAGQWNPGTVVVNGVTYELPGLE